MGPGLEHLHRRNLLLWGSALSLYAFVVLFSTLDYSVVYQVSEAREGVVVHEILTSRNFILPLRNGEIVPSKPILFHWFGALGAKLLGSFDEFTLRLPSALGALGVVLALFLFVARVATPAMGFISGILLLATYGFFNLAHDGRVDMLFTFFSVAAVTTWLRWAHSVFLLGYPLKAISAKVYWQVGFLCGLAVLAKGPLGLALPGLVILGCAVFLFGAGWTSVVFRRGWLAAILLPLPWYLAASQAGERSFVQRQIIFENLARFFGGEKVNEKPLWFYLPEFLNQAFPWSLLFLLYVFFLARARWRKQTPNPFLPKHPSAQFCVKAGLVWFFVPFLFFSLSAGKRSAYLLPILPAVSLVLTFRIAATWQRLRESGELGKLFSPRIFRFGLGLWCFVVALAVGTVLVSHLPSEAFGHEFSVTLRSVPLAFERHGGRIAALFVLLGGVSLWGWLRGFARRKELLVGGAVVLFLQMVIMVHVATLEAVQGVTHTYKGFAGQLRLLSGGERPFFVKTLLDESFDGLFFYLRKHVTMVHPEKKPTRPGLYVARRSWLEANRSALLVQELAEGGRLIDERGERLVVFRLRGE